MQNDASYMGEWLGWLAVWSIDSQDWSFTEVRLNDSLAKTGCHPAMHGFLIHLLIQRILHYTQHFPWQAAMNSLPHMEQHAARAKCNLTRTHFWLQRPSTYSYSPAHYSSNALMSNVTLQVNYASLLFYTHAWYLATQKNQPPFDVHHECLIISIILSILPHSTLTRSAYLLSLGYTPWMNEPIYLSPGCVHLKPFCFI